MYKCVIFDCDGVLVDSEDLSNQTILKMLWELDIPMTEALAIDVFTGRALSKNLAWIEDYFKVNLPDNFESEYRRRSFEAFKNHLKPVAGVQQLLKRLVLPKCVASSGPIKKMELNLFTTGLLGYFNGNLFSCYEINSWKPEPDIFLHAAKEMGFQPHQCVVIEDSEPGIKAAQAGGFKVYAYKNAYNKKLLDKLDIPVIEDMNKLDEILGLRH